MTLSTFWLLLKETAIGWDQDNIARHGAALSFYTLFSMAPLLLIVIAIAGSAFGREAVEGRIVEEIQLLVGASGARTVQEVIRNSSGPGRSATALTVGIVTFFLGATAAFAALQGASTRYGMSNRGRGMLSGASSAPGSFHSQWWWGADSCYSCPSW